MTPEYKCGIAAVTETLKSDVDNTYRDLKKSVDDINNKLASLTADDERLIVKQGYNVKKLRNSIKMFDNIHTEYINEEKKLNNYRSSQKDSLDKLISNDHKNLVMSLLAITTTIVVFSLLK